MSEYDELDGDVDWDEAAKALDDFEQSQKQSLVSDKISDTVNIAYVPGEQYDRESSTFATSVAGVIADVEELSVLYDILDKEEQTDVIAKELGDIEDIGMSATQAGAVARAGKTLYNAFRRRKGFLSVTDLTAPSGWCEVQYTYSLIGRRDLKPEDRPERIVTAQGKEIKVDKKIQIAHEKVLQKGRDVHKVLEREIHPEQVTVHTSTKADRWGLRLLNQLVSLQTLHENGKAREVPILGFVKDTFVIGVMDEIERRALPGQEKESPASPKPGQINHFFQPKTPPAKKALQTGLYLVDSKTRRTPSLPHQKYTVASQFQLMLYKRMFDAHAAGDFDWDRFFGHIGIETGTAFSASFLEQTQPIYAGLENVTQARTLGGMAESLRAQHLVVGKLQDDLELVYRWRGSSKDKSAEARAAKRARRAKISSWEQEQIQQAIAASTIPAAFKIEDTSATDQHSEVPLRFDPSVLVSVIAAGLSEDGFHGPAQGPPSSQQLGSRDQPIPLSPASSPPPSAPAVSEPSLSTETIATECAGSLQPKTASFLAAETMKEEGEIIGVEAFKYDESRLEGYLENALSFWQGRPAKGVGPDEVNKCRTCEFQDGCEWLATKAEEHLQASREKRRIRESQK